MKNTLKVINSLEETGIIGKYAIGGAIGVIFYAEPTATYDLDIFCILGESEGGLINLGPLYAFLVGERGYPVEGEHIVIEGIPVQFLPPGTNLVREALENAAELQFDGVPTRVFKYEYLLAIMAETGRAKDKTRINQVLESAEPDLDLLNNILARYDLLDKWAKIVA